MKIENPHILTKFFQLKAKRQDKTSYSMNKYCYHKHRETKQKQDIKSSVYTFGMVCK